MAGGSPGATPLEPQCHRQEVWLPVEVLVSVLVSVVAVEVEVAVAVVVVVAVAPMGSLTPGQISGHTSVQ